MTVPMSVKGRSEKQTPQHAAFSCMLVPILSKGFLMFKAEG
jgi:hypothetical protein